MTSLIKDMITDTADYIAVVTLKGDNSLADLQARCKDARVDSRVILGALALVNDDMRGLCSETDPRKLESWMTVGRAVVHKQTIKGLVEYPARVGKKKLMGKLKDAFKLILGHVAGLDEVLHFEAVPVLKADQKEVCRRTKNEQNILAKKLEQGLDNMVGRQMSDIARLEATQRAAFKQAEADRAAKAQAASDHRDEIAAQQAAEFESFKKEMRERVAQREREAETNAVLIREIHGTTVKKQRPPKVSNVFNSPPQQRPVSDNSPSPRRDLFAPEMSPEASEHALPKEEEAGHEESKHGATSPGIAENGTQIGAEAAAAALSPVDDLEHKLDGLKVAAPAIASPAPVPVPVDDLDDASPEGGVDTTAAFFTPVPATRPASGSSDRMLEDVRDAETHQKLGDLKPQLASALKNRAKQCAESTYISPAQQKKDDPNYIPGKLLGPDEPEPSKKSEKKKKNKFFPWA